MFVDLDEETGKYRHRITDLASGELNSSMSDDQDDDEGHAFKDKPIEAEEQKELDLLLAKAIYSSGAPISLLHNPYWIELMTLIRPTYKMPDHLNNPYTLEGQRNLYGRAKKKHKSKEPKTTVVEEGCESQVLQVNFYDPSANIGNTNGTVNPPNDGNNVNVAPVPSNYNEMCMVSGVVTGVTTATVSQLLAPQFNGYQPCFYTTNNGTAGAPEHQQPQQQPQVTTNGQTSSSTAYIQS